MVKVSQLQPKTKQVVTMYLVQISAEAPTILTEVSVVFLSPSQQLQG